jgi:predicted dehydrogenase
LAEKNKVILMTGHVYLYNPGIRKLKEYIKENKLGKIYYLKSERMALGPIRKKGSVLWDLAIHDVYVALYLLEEMPTSVFAQGGDYLQKDIEDFVNLNLKFPKNIFCSIGASWFAPQKIRELMVVGSEGMAIFDDVDKHEMLKIYERKINKNLLGSTPHYSDHQNIVNVGDVYTPHIEQSEPLKNQAIHFIECIKNNKNPLTSGEEALKVIKVLEEAERTLKRYAHQKC